MLTNLHVKNLALIDEAEVEFGPGLNILTGETGAGKSIVIGSVSLALGGKVSFNTAVRFEKGEGIEKKQENFAAEIASMVNGNK